MGLLQFFLGLDISQNDSGIKIDQSEYVRDLFHMTDCNPTTTP